MKLLLDENLSHKLVALLVDVFPDCVHVESVLKRGDTDTSVWEFAKASGYVIVSRDNDFRQRVFLLGSQPKVIWLETGNNRSAAVAKLLKDNKERIHQFVGQPEEGLLILP